MYLVSWCHNRQTKIRISWFMIMTNDAKRIRTWVCINLCITGQSFTCCDQKKWYDNTVHRKGKHGFTYLVRIQAAEYIIQDTERRIRKYWNTEYRKQNTGYTIQCKWGQAWHYTVSQGVTGAIVRRPHEPQSKRVQLFVLLLIMDLWASTLRNLSTKQ